MVMQPFGEVAMRIDHAEPATLLQILASQRLHQGRLAGARLADEIEVRKPVGLLDSEPDKIAPVIGLAEIRYLHAFSMAPWSQRRTASLHASRAYSRHKKAGGVMPPAEFDHGGYS